MPSNELTDARSIRLSFDDYTSNNDESKTDSDDDCLKRFDITSQAEEQHDNSGVCLFFVVVPCFMFMSSVSVIYCFLVEFHIVYRCSQTSENLGKEIWEKMQRGSDES